MRDKDPRDFQLERFDRWSKGFFYAGVVCVVLLGSAVTLSQDRRKELVENDKGKGTSGDKKLNESLAGIQRLAPKNLDIGKSLSGISNLSPQNIQPRAQSNQQSQSSNPTERVTVNPKERNPQVAGDPKGGCGKTEKN